MPRFFPRNRRRSRNPEYIRHAKEKIRHGGGVTVADIIEKARMNMARGGAANMREIVGVDSIAEGRFVLAQNRLAGT